MDFKLTSVKILTALYKNFKSEAVSNEFTLQKLVNRSILLYTTDTEFKNQIQATIVVSGSHL